MIQKIQESDVDKRPQNIIVSWHTNPVAVAASKCMNVILVNISALLVDGDELWMLGKPEEESQQRQWNSSSMRPHVYTTFQ